MEVVLIYNYYYRFGFKNLYIIESLFYLIKMFFGLGVGLICNVIIWNRFKKLVVIVISGYENYFKIFIFIIFLLFKF